MRTQIHNEHWKWIVWLIILILLNAIALAAGRPQRGGRDRSSSDSKPESAGAQQSPPPARTQEQPAPAAPARESRPASQPAPQPRRTETTASATQSDAPRREVRSRPQSDSNNQAASSQNQVQTVERSRPVRHEVIVAPSSQSLDVSSSQAVTQTVPSSTTAKTTRAGRDRTVEVKQVQSEQGGSSVASTIRPARRDRATETIQITADNGGTSRQQGRASDSNRQSFGRTERTNQPQAKADSTVSSPSVTTVDTAKSQETAVSVTSQAKSDSTKVSNRSGNSRNTHTGTVIRYGGKQSENRKNDPIVVKTDEIKTQPQRGHPSQSDGQRSDNNERSIKPQSQDRSQTPSVVASGTDDLERAHRSVNSESSGRRPDNRWSRLRSKITAQADVDMVSCENRPDRENHIRRDENRGRIVFNDNNINVERGRGDDHHRPFVARHLLSDIRPIRSDHRWQPRGSSFIFHWSDSSCGRVILAPYQHYYGISYYYPSYHRKYLFVSLGGYWPYSYRYQRYYWYGCHPYYWYGSDVVSQPDTVVYDYTTYNYYNSTSTVAAGADVTTNLVEDSTATDAPLPQTQADICFADAVNAFEGGRYDNAVELFRQAVLMSPEDEILPFTYTQVLFANGDYALSAYVLREVMAKMPSEEPAVYFPRGLYKDDQILSNQIAKLENAITVEPFCTDYQLLLGYQYLGIGQWDKAVNALEQAARSPLNANIVTKLLDIAEKMESDAKTTELVNQS